jgi:uncharacterized protein (TIGR01777 family)
MKVVVAGGSGMLGRALSASLVADGVEVVHLSRRANADAQAPGVRAAHWDGRSLDGAWTGELAVADAVIDLCGLSVGTWPWTGRTRASLRSSRLEPRSALVEAMRGLPASARPGTYIALSGTDGYVGSDAMPATEDTPFADTFLGALCRDWEAAASPAVDLGIRLVIARTCVVVARGAPAMARLALPVRLLVGGRIGSGRQWFSWVHIDDWVAAMRLILGDERITGVVNIASPAPLPQIEVARALGRILRRPSVVWTPALAVRLVLGGQADLVLGSRRVSSARLEEVGMTFAWSDFEAAARDALG